MYNPNTPSQVPLSRECLEPLLNALRDQTVNVLTQLTDKLAHNKSAAQRILRLMKQLRNGMEAEGYYDDEDRFCKDRFREERFCKDRFREERFRKDRFREKRFCEESFRVKRFPE